MSSRVLLDAEAHRRRRLVIALITADPQGGDDVLPRVGPVLWGGLLALLMVSGSLLVGVLTPQAPTAWDDGRLVVGRASGARFVSLRGTLHPVLNTTSARLLLPAGAAWRVEVVDDAAIDAAPHGPVLGIPGAPDDLAAPGALVPSGWVACLDGSRVRTTIGSRAPPAEAGAVALTVRVVASGAHHDHLLVDGRRFRIPSGAGDAFTRLLGRSAPVVTAPTGWVDLFTAGPALEQRAFRFPVMSPPGQPLDPGLTAGGRLHRVGQLLSDVDHDGAVSVVVADGTIPLSPFAAAVYRATVRGVDTRPVTVVDADLMSVPISPTRGFVPDEWPVELPGVATGLPCASLETRVDGHAATHLVFTAPDSTWARPPGEADVWVEPGHGALVRAGEAPDTGPVVVVDPTASACTVPRASGETLARLGYRGVQPVPVPPSWVRLLHRGPDLVPLDAPDLVGPPSRGRSGGG